MGIFQGRSKGSWFGFVADAGQDMASLRGIERTTVATVVVTCEGDYRNLLLDSLRVSQ